MTLRILFATPCEPLSNGSGSNRRSSVALEALVRLGDVYYLCAPTNDGGREESARTERADWLSSVREVLHARDIYRRDLAVWHSFMEPSRAERILKRAWITAGEMCGISPSQGRCLVAALREQFGSEGFDVIYIFQAHAAMFMANVLEQIRSPRSVVVIDWDAAERPAIAEQYRHRGTGFKAALGRIVNDAKMAWFERRLLALADLTLCAARQDIPYFESRRGRGLVAEFQNCTEIPEVQVPADEAGEAYQILFVGLINYWPNREGLLNFLENVWPRVRARYPRAVFSIVGRGVTADVARWDGVEGVRVIGAVDALEPFYAACHVAIAPMRFSVGSAIKILEALAHGRPVVAFDTALMRHELRDGVNAFGVASTQEFADKLIAVLADRDSRIAVAQAGRRHVLENNSRVEVVRKLTLLVAEAAKDAGIRA